MRKTILAACALSAVIGLSACGGGYGYYGAEAGPPDVYYDGFYGPYNDGYWADDGFYYRDRGGHFQHGDSAHFQRGMFTGARGYHAHAHAAPAARAGGEEHH
jgi:hypothetical protein